MASFNLATKNSSQACEKFAFQTFWRSMPAIKADLAGAADAGRLLAAEQA
jgi:hypothetical protein